MFSRHHTVQACAIRVHKSGTCDTLPAFNWPVSPMRLLHALIDPRFATLRLRAAWVIYFSILIFGAVPGARSEIGEYASGLVLHFFAYGCISFLLFTGMAGHPHARALRTVLIVACMGAADEFMQSFLPYRRGAISDWYIDMSASVFVSMLLWAAAFRVEALRVRDRK